VPRFSVRQALDELRHGPQQPHPGVMEIRVWAGAEYLCYWFCLDIPFAGSWPGGGRNINVLFIDYFTCTFMLLTILLCFAYLYLLYIFVWLDFELLQVVWCSYST